MIRILGPRFSATVPEPAKAVLKTVSFHSARPQNSATDIGKYWEILCFISDHFVLVFVCMCVFVAFGALRGGQPPMTLKKSTMTTNILKDPLHPQRT